MLQPTLRKDAQDMEQSLRMKFVKRCFLSVGNRSSGRFVFTVFAGALQHALSTRSGIASVEVRFT
jgi:hypothetical protein